MSAPSFIKGLGHYLPAGVLTNADLEKMVDTSDEWIVLRTGIRQRHIAAAHEQTSDLAHQAALRALQSAGLRPEDLDAIIVATTTPDQTLPQTACSLQNKLGAQRAFAFDIQAACSGFVYALSVGDALIKAQGLKNVLVVGAETLSRITNYRDRETCILFGDGAGAVILSAEQNDAKMPLHFHLWSDGSIENILSLRDERPRDPFATNAPREWRFLEMKGKEVFKHAVRAMTSASAAVLSKAGLEIDDVDLFIPHQANQRILSAVADLLHINSHKVVSTLEVTGNTSSASIPIVLSQAFEAGTLKRGQKVLLAAFGAGLTSGAAVFEF